MNRSLSGRGKTPSRQAQAFRWKGVMRSIAGEIVQSKACAPATSVARVCRYPPEIEGDSAPFVGRQTRYSIPFYPPDTSSAYPNPNPNPSPESQPTAFKSAPTDVDYIHGLKHECHASSLPPSLHEVRIGWLLVTILVARFFLAHCVVSCFASFGCFRRGRLCCPK